MDAPFFRRRNGRPQACEPCRKRKVACDHTHPVCRRCVKRKQERSCVYVVSDGARDNMPPGPSPRAVRASSRRAQLSLSPPPPAVSLQTKPGDDKSTPAPAPSGYLGYTSYCSVFEETESILTGSTLRSAGTSTPGREFVRAGAASSSKLSPWTLGTCLRVLNNVPEPTAGIERFPNTQNPFDSFPYVIAKRILQSFYDTLGQYLGRDRNPLHLELVARRLCRNTTRPFSETEPDAEKWAGQLLGDNLRWESVGILFTYWGSKTEIREILGFCVDLCTELSHGNSPLVYLHLKYTNAESCSSGDASLRTWKGHADTVALLTFLGLHAETNPPDYEPTLASELRRSLYTWVFSLDMSVVSFTGRPPLLNSAFSSTPLPLDLSNEALISDKVSRARALRRLDRDGWGDGSKIHPATVRRARATLTAIKERILRIALGHGDPLSVDALLELKDAALEAFARLPAVLHYGPGDLHDSSITKTMLYPRLLIHMEHLQNILFIERLLLRHGKEGRADILTVSFELVSAMLPLWTHRERFADIRDDNDWLVMAYAAPAGGILCLELLKPTLHTGLQANPEITRSSIIQKLSLLIGFLDWTRPFAPNADLCADCSLIIRHVLDHSLNTVSLEGEMPNTFEWDLDATQLDFNFDLLDTFDWLRPDGNVATG